MTLPVESEDRYRCAAEDEYFVLRVDGDAHGFDEAHLIRNPRPTLHRFVAQTFCFRAHAITAASMRSSGTSYDCAASTI